MDIAVTAALSQLYNAAAGQVTVPNVASKPQPMACSRKAQHHTGSVRITALSLTLVAAVIYIGFYFLVATR